MWLNNINRRKGTMEKSFILICSRYATNMIINKGEYTCLQ